MDLTQITLQHKVHILHTGNGTHNCSAGFREREALGYSTCEAPPNSPPSRLGEYGSVFSQFQ